MRRQLSEQKSDFLDWHMSDEWNPFKVVRSQHDESNTAGYSRVQWSDESPHPRVGQTQRDLLDGRTADCEGKRFVGLLEGCEVGTSWFCLNTKDPHTLCKDFEKGPWDTSVVFQNTLSLLWIYLYFDSPITYVGWWKGLPEGWFAIDSWALFPISAHGWQYGT